MSQNPFGGEGGFDLNAMLEQAQQMQSQLMAAQEELAETLVEGSVGGVSVQVSGTGELRGLTIRPGTFDGSDEESLTDLGDLVVAAYRDAKGRADEAAAQVMSPFAGAAQGEDPFGSLGLGGGLPGGHDGSDGPDGPRSGGGAAGFGV